ncbi:hypothetical protein [Roseobacter weihaiensis]|nr:hypothetical protein [Roseobacter sp. H9]
MSHYVGLDVSLNEVTVFVVDAEGTVSHRASPGAFRSRSDHGRVV